MQTIKQDSYIVRDKLMLEMLYKRQQLQKEGSPVPLTA